MIEYLINIDKELFLFLNSFHSVFWDEVMLIITGKKTWIPMYLVILFYIFRTYKLKGFIVLLFIVLTITLADQISVKLFKNIFERLRPCYNPEIKDILHCPRLSGGHFGFVSSHAANTFGFALFSLLLFKNLKYSIFIVLWATVVSYSRIYLGVHYPADIVGGALLGIIIGIVVYKLYTLAIKINFSKIKPKIKN